MRTLLYLLLLASALATAAFGLLAVRDYSALVRAYRVLEETKPGTSIHQLSILIRASTFDAIHRINVAADGTWALLSAVVMAICLHALLISRQLEQWARRFPSPPDR